MPRLARNAIPLVGPDELDELEAAAAARGLTVTVNTIAQSRGFPCIELRRPADPLVCAVFRHASQAMAWLGGKA